jgi:hypothetical protein
LDRSTGPDAGPSGFLLFNTGLALGLGVKISFDVITEPFGHCLLYLYLHERPRSLQHGREPP